MKKIFLGTLSFSLFLINISAWALVDYGEDDTVRIKQYAPQKKAANKSYGAIANSSPASTGGWTFDFNFSASYESLALEIPEEGAEGKLSLIREQLNIRTNKGAWLELGFFHSAYDNLSYNGVEQEEISSSYQNGNPRVLLGINWLSLSDLQGSMSLDTYLGASFAASGAPYGGHSRDDKILGMAVAKRINMMLFKLGGEYIITGNAKEAEEVQIGDLTRLTAGLGYIVSNDIRLSLEWTQTEVSAADKLLRMPRLEENYKFSVLTPRMLLNFTPNLALDLGASFQTRVVGGKKSDLAKAGLLEYQGALGNTMFAGLNVFF